MGELLCPIHGIPAIVIGFFFGDVSILYLTITMIRIKLSTLFKFRRIGTIDGGQT